MFLTSGIAFAACSAPAGVAGEMGFDVTGSGGMEYCDDTNWVPMNSSLASTSSGGSGGGSATNFSFLDSVDFTSTPASLDDPSVVTIDGDYAYVGTHYENGGNNGIAIVDISDPSNLSIVGSIGNSVLYSPTNLQVVGDYLFFCGGSGGDRALRSIDISTKSAPVLEDSESSNTTCQNGGGFDIVGSYAYSVGYQQDGISVHDISDPTNITFIDGVSADTGLAGDGPYAIDVEGNYAYIAGYDSNEFSVVDISNPASISNVGSVTNGTAFTSPVTVVKHPSADVVYVGNEDFNSPSVIAVVDVSTPASPSASTFDPASGANSCYTGLKLVGDILYATEACSDRAIYVIDVSTPLSPSLINEISVGSNCPTGTGHNHFGVDLSGSTLIMNCKQDALVTSWLGSTLGLHLHWSLDETSGETITDSSGNGFTGDWNESGADDVGGETITGKIDTALSFSSGKYIQDTDYVMPDEGTFAAWVVSDFYESNEPAGAFPVLFWAENPDTIFLYNTSGEYFSLFTNGSSTGRATYSPPADITGWYHIAATWSSTGSQIYLNGQAVGTTGVGDHSAGTPAGGFALSTRLPSYDRYWNGDIDDFRIYNTPLSASEILQLYNEGKNPGLVGHWKLDESAGTTVPDFSGYGYDGTFYNTPTWQPSGGKIDGALEFDSSNVEGIDLPNDLYDDLATGTISAWVNWEGANDYRQIFVSGQDGWFEFNIQNGKLDLWSTGCTSNVRASSSQTLIADKWYHVAFTNDGSGNKFYINGQQAAMSYSVGNSSTDIFFDQCTSVATTEYAIGWTSSLSDTEVFDGKLDDVRVYNRALSDSEIAILAICTKPGELGYNYADHVIQWCDDFLDAYNAGAAGAGGGGCAASGSKAAGAEGAIQYDTANNKMVFCDGASWVDIPN